MNLKTADAVKVFSDKYGELQKFINKTLFSAKVFTERDNIQRQISKKLLEMNSFAYRFSRRYILRAYFDAQIESEKTFKKLEIDRVKKRTDYSVKVADNFVKIVIKRNRSIEKSVKSFLKAIKKSDKKLRVELQNFTETEFRKEIDKVIKAGLTAKFRQIGRRRERVTKSRYEIQRDLMLMFKKKYGEINFIQITGKDGISRNYDIKKYSKMLARTEIIKAKTDAVLQSSKEHGSDLVIVSRHANPCPICQPYEGQVYSISGDSDKYPSYSDISVPFHPNCGHSLSPISEISIKFQKKFTKFPAQTKNKPKLDERIEELRSA